MFTLAEGTFLPVVVFLSCLIHTFHLLNINSYSKRFFFVKPIKTYVFHFSKVHEMDSHSFMVPQ